MISQVRRLPGQRGSAPLEFVLVAPLVILVFAAIVQIGLVVHVRATLVSAAAEGARAGALAGSSLQTAETRTRSAVNQSVASGVVESIHATRRSEFGVEWVAVRIQARLPLVGLLGPTGLEVTGHALEEPDADR